MHAMHTWPERGSDTPTDLMLGLLVRVAALEANTLPRDPSAMLHPGQLVHLSFYSTTHTSRGLSQKAVSPYALRCNLPESVEIYSTSALKYITRKLTLPRGGG